MIQLSHLYVTIRKTMANLGSILKSRDLSLPTNVHLVKAMAFPVMYRCELDHKAELRRIDAFELWCWRRESLGLKGDPASPS